VTSRTIGAEYILIQLRTCVSGSNVGIDYIQTYIPNTIGSGIHMYNSVHMASNIQAYITIGIGDSKSTFNNIRSIREGNRTVMKFFDIYEENKIGYRDN